MRNCKYSGHEWQDREPIIDESVVEQVCLHCDEYRVIPKELNRNE